jgi:NADH-quinone oxidoreductase subunit H
MISYEIPMGLTILMVLLITGSLLPFEMIKYQTTHGWLILAQPMVAALFFICMLAECNRAPFDNAECEAELVGGYHTEYSSMSFGLFALGEYIHMAVGCAMFAIMFLGGYQVLPGVTIPWLDPSDMTVFGVLAKFSVLFGKMFTLVCFCIVVRWTLPRLRFDQVMAMAWQAVIPLALILVVANAVFVFNGWTALWQTLAMNAGVALLVLMVQPLLPKAISNKKIPMAGSRFSPLADEAALMPLPAHAREDRPIESMAGMNI